MPRGAPAKTGFIDVVRSAVCVFDAIRKLGSVRNNGFHNNGVRHLGFELSAEPTVVCHDVNSLADLEARIWHCRRVVLLS